MKQVNESVEEVVIVDDTSIKVEGIHYDIVGPTETLYADREYIEFNGAIWTKH